MGKISEIYSSYKKSLDKSQSDYERSVKGTSENSKQLYDDFFKKMISFYSESLNASNSK